MVNFGQLYISMGNAYTKSLNGGELTEKRQTGARDNSRF